MIQIVEESVEVLVMGMFRKSFFWAAAFGFAALVSTQANANLIISANGTTVSNTDTSNMTASFAGSVGGFNINNLFVAGAAAFGGNGLLLDVTSLDISTSGAGNLTLLFTETNLTGMSPSVFNTEFSAATFKNISATRSVFLDTTNQGLSTTLLSMTSGANSITSSTPQILSGPYSLTEEIDLTALSVGATLSADDQVTVPEPATLGLFGVGLVVIGVSLRRRRSGAPVGA